MKKIIMCSLGLMGLIQPALAAIPLDTVRTNNDQFYQNPQIGNNDLHMITSTTKQAINQNCADVNLAQPQAQSLCVETIDTLVMSFMQDYAAQFAPEGNIAAKSQNYAAFAATNMGRICPAQPTEVKSVEVVLDRNLKCVLSIFDIENKRAVNDPQYGFDSTNIQTRFNRDLFNVIAMGTICTNGKIRNTAPEKGACAASAAENGLNFKP